jgi:hypothetical protein
MKSIEERIDLAFGKYTPTLELLKTFISNKSNHQEFLLLACGRLDSISNLAFSGDALKNNFITFLNMYSGLKEKCYLISVPDLYDFLNYQLWILPGSLEKEGRYFVFNPKEDEKYVSFIWSSGVAITQKHVGLLLKFILNVLKKYYRVTPNQVFSKKSTDTVDDIVKNILNECNNRKKTFYTEGITSAKSKLQEFIKEYSVGSLLYKEHRCAIIHEYGVLIKEQSFFRKKEYYWEPRYRKYGNSEKALTIQFPAHFLFDILNNSIRNYKNKLKQTKLLPFSIHSEICDFDSELKYLDQDSIKEGKYIGMSKL